MKNVIIHALRGVCFFGVLTICNWGYAATLSGKIVFEGTAPEPKKLSLDADPSCSALHADGLDSEEVVVNANGTLKNVFVYVKEGAEGKKYDTPKEPVVLDQQGCRYVPHVVGIQVNQPVQLINSDATLHNVHAVAETNKEFNLGMPIKGMKFKKKFTKPEVMVKFKCDVHPWMSAYGGVLDHPFHSVSDDTGAFEIKDLPAGTYTIEAWHEKYGVQTSSVTIAEGADQTLEFTYAA